MTKQIVVFRQLANATKKCINFSKIETKSKPSRWTQPVNILHSSSYKIWPTLGVFLFLDTNKPNQFCSGKAEHLRPTLHLLCSCSLGVPPSYWRLFFPNLILYRNHSNIPTDEIGNASDWGCQKHTNYTHMFSPLSLRLEQNNLLVYAD
jgi:hypothetical protein